MGGVGEGCLTARCPLWGLGTHQSPWGIKGMLGEGQREIMQFFPFPFSFC